ncbi:hypothetical protein BDZ89DRAFT_1152530 [Hymenopellis radicata]|nr:hypothetical protein BDZ89DRAFT_1152530 [Hymenopellis radicata]
MPNPSNADCQKCQHDYEENPEVYFTRLSQSAILSKYLPLYNPISTSAQSDAVARHLFSLKFPSEPSTRLDLDADVAYQCILVVLKWVAPRLPPSVELRLQSLSPLLMRWCIHFLGAISWENVGANVQTSVPSPLLLLAYLFRVGGEDVMTHNRRLFQHALSVLFPILDMTLFPSSTALLKLYMMGRIKTL